mgnify:CR=1 FL=1
MQSQLVGPRWIGTQRVLPVSEVSASRIRSIGLPSPIDMPCDLCTTVAQPGLSGRPVRVAPCSSSIDVVTGMGTHVGWAGSHAGPV